jgi:hypothetical protein
VLEMGGRVYGDDEGEETGGGEKNPWLWDLKWLFDGVEYMDVGRLDEYAAEENCVGCVEGCVDDPPTYGGCWRLNEEDRP